MNDKLSEKCTDSRFYDPPICQVFVLDTHRVICASETETVGEVDGEW